MKESYYINGNIFEAEDIESEFELAYLGFRDGLSIDNTSVKFQNIYNHLVDSIEKLWPNIDNKNMVDVLLELANDIKRFIDELENEINNYETKYQPTVFAFLDSEKLVFEYGFVDSEFETLKQHEKLIWENLDNMPIGLYFDGYEAFIAPLNGDNIHTEDLPRIFEVSHVDFFAYQTEKEIYTEYCNLLAINKSIWEQAEKLYQIMEFKEIDINNKPAPEKEKSQKPPGRPKVQKPESINAIFKDKGYERLNEIIVKNTGSNSLEDFMRQINTRGYKNISVPETLRSKKQNEAIGPNGVVMFFKNIEVKGWTNKERYTQVHLSELITEVTGEKIDRFKITRNENDGFLTTGKEEQDIFSFIPSFLDTIST